MQPSHLEPGPVGPDLHATEVLVPEVADVRRHRATAAAPRTISDPDRRTRWTGAVVLVVSALAVLVVAIVVTLVTALVVVVRFAAARSARLAVAVSRRTDR